MAFCKDGEACEFFKDGVHSWLGSREGFGYEPIALARRAYKSVPNAVGGEKLSWRDAYATRVASVAAPYRKYARAGQDKVSPGSLQR